MAGTKGNRDERLDRIEKAVDQMIADHEKAHRDHRQMLIAQVLQKEEIEDLLKVTREQTEQLKEEGRQRREADKFLEQRVTDLVSAIGAFIQRLPPMAPPAKEA